jgi:hypothetical protein
MSSYQGREQRVHTRDDTGEKLPTPKAVYCHSLFSSFHEQAKSRIPYCVWQIGKLRPEEASEEPWEPGPSPSDKAMWEKSEPSEWLD